MSSEREPSFAAVCAAGFVALAVAMGIGRFAFTPVLPLMIQAGSADVASGGWLAAANYAGYLAGALSAARLRLDPQRLTIAALVAVALSTVAMGWTASPWIWVLLRFVAGVASAWVLVSTSVWCLGWLASLGRAAGAGVLYAGVGAGIAVAGMWCWHAGAVAVAPESLWLQLGTFAVGGIVIVVAAMPRQLANGKQTASVKSRTSSKRDDTGLVVCYGLLGFGYILPATFLPVLAHAVIADPALFGLAWPVFGVAAAASTLLAGVALAPFFRRRVLAGSHLLMAVGCLLPVLHLSPLTVLAAALLVGSTFMVATMAGMQAARAETEGDPTRALGRLTAAFAIGQIAGPMMSSSLSIGSEGFGGLMMALCGGALAVLASAAWLWRSRP